MVKTVELKVAMMRRGLTQAKAAEALGICQGTLSGKINNKHQFKVSEIAKLRDLLGLSPEQMNEIFLEQA